MNYILEVNLICEICVMKLNYGFLKIDEKFLS